MQFLRKLYQHFRFLLIIFTAVKATFNDESQPLQSGHLEGVQHNGSDQFLPTNHQSRRMATHSPMKNEINVTIAVVGRSGSGVSTTIRELIGGKTKCKMPEAKETLKNIMEYSIHIPSSDGNTYKLKLLDIPGFIESRTLEQESQILASLKSIVQTSGPLDFYLALSRFDENRMGGIHTLLQFVKRLELFHNVFLNNTFVAKCSTGNNILFLLTRLMSVTKPLQQRPDETLSAFKAIIENFTVLPRPISIIVGDNKAASEYGVNIENGYYKLPNNQLYPKNIWEGLINLSENFTDMSKTRLLSVMMNSREVEMKCDAKLVSTEWENYDDDADAFLYLLEENNYMTVIEDTDINREIQIAYEQNNLNRMEGIIQNIALQMLLQQANITTREDLPQTTAERASFFQNNKLFSAIIPARLLDLAFGLKIPEYSSQTTVGYGYLLMEDELSPFTPFETETFEPSPMGYSFPNFMKCTKLLIPETHYFKSYSANMSEYIEERLKYLYFEGKENVTKNEFSLKVKDGFNLQPEEWASVATLTTVEERRILRCQLVSDFSQLSLKEEFIEDVMALTKFNRSDRDSVNEWNNWFDKWGSHLVVASYGGGRLHGSIVGSNVTNVLASRSSVDITLNSILNFAPFPEDNLGTPSYKLYGGESDPVSRNLYNLQENVRKAVIKRWEETLSSKFIMLANEFHLEPISKLIAANNKTNSKARVVEEAIELLLSGKLKYVRKRKVSNKQSQDNNINNVKGNVGNEENSRLNNNQEHRTDKPEPFNTVSAPTPTVKRNKRIRHESLYQVTTARPTLNNIVHRNGFPSIPSQPTIQSNLSANHSVIQYLQSEIQNNELELDAIREQTELLRARMAEDERRHQLMMTKLKQEAEDRRHQSLMKELREEAEERERQGNCHWNWEVVKCTITKAFNYIAQ